MPESRSYGKTCMRLAVMPPAGCIATNPFFASFPSKRAHSLKSGIAPA